MLSLDRQTVIGALKASGSKDPDVLYTTKKKLIEQTRGLRMWSWIPIICGVLLTLTIIGAFIGIPMIIIGIWLRMKTGKNLRIAEEAYNEYLASVGGASPVMSAAAA